MCDKYYWTNTFGVVPAIIYNSHIHYLVWISRVDPLKLGIDYYTVGVTMYIVKKFTNIV